MQTRNLDTYRTQAEATSSLNLSLPPTLSSGPRQNTERALNRMRLTMYIQQIDGSTFDIVNDAEAIKKWIESHTVETQVFMNVLGANPALKEDGIRGERTVNCINSLFNITIPVTHEKVSDISADGVLLPTTLLENKEIIEQMQKTGILINGDRAVIENPRLLEQFNQYLDLLNFIEDTARESSNAEIKNKEKLMDNYVSIINEGTDFITEDLKEVLAYKYAEAINNDIHRMGGSIVRDGVNGEYTIIDYKTGKKMDNNPYFRVLTEVNTRNILDVARVIGIVRNNFDLNEEKLIGDAPFIRKLLEQHEIKDTSGTRIIKAEQLLIQKDHVMKQIDDKITAVTDGKATSHKAFEELNFLKDYISQGETPRVNYMRSILTQVNEYKGFLRHQATIGSNWTPEKIAHATDKDWVDIAADAVKNNALSAFFLGLIAWFMGKKNVAFGLIGISFFSGTISKGIHAAGNIGKSALSDSDLELVQMRDIDYPLNNSIYQKGYESLATLNRTNGESQDTTLPQLDNKKLYDITNEITEKELEISMSGTTSDIVGRIQAVLTVGGNPKYTQEEITTFVRLLQQGDTPSGSTTILDYLTVGENLLTETYEVRNFTVDDTFDSAINDHLMARWNTNIPSNTVSRTQALNGRKQINDLSDLIENTLSNGIFNGLTDSLFSLDWEKLNRATPEQITNINALIGKIEGMSGLSDTTKLPLTKDILPNLITYILVSEQLAEYEKGDGIIVKALEVLPGIPTESQIKEKITTIDTILSKMRPMSFEVNGTPYELTSSPLFVSILERMSTRISELEQKNTELENQLLTIIIEENTKVRTKVSFIKSGFSDLKASGNQATKFINNNGDRIKDIQRTWNEIKGKTFPAGSDDLDLQNELRPLFETGGLMEQIQSELTIKFTQYYKENQDNIILLGAIPTTFSGVSDIIRTQVELNRVFEGYKSQLGNVESFLAYLQGTEPLSKIEKAHNSAVKIFPNLTVVGTDNTINKVAEAAKQKQDNVSKAAFNFVNALTSTDYNEGNFKILHEMDTLGIVDMFEAINLGVNTREIFAKQYAQCAISYIRSIPSTTAGISQLRMFDDMYLSVNPSLGTKILDWWKGGVNIGEKFTDQVGIVANDILRSPDFSEDLPGLQKILSFYKDSNTFGWLVKKSPILEVNLKERVKLITEKVLTFYPATIDGLNKIIAFKTSSEYTDSFGIVGSDLDDMYEARIEAMRNSIINTTITKDSSLVISGSETLNDVIDRNASRSINTSSSLKTFILRNRTIKELIDEFNLDSSISGNYPTTNGIDEISRKDIYNALVQLKLK